MFQKIGEYSIPSYAVCYLEYGEADGLEPEDIGNIDGWLAREFDGFHSLCFDYTRDDASFTPYPEFGLACDTLDCAVWGHTA